jgi:deferrochelatase/peroxidase EfeB
MIYAIPDLFDDWKHTLASQMQHSGLIVMHCLSTEDMGNIEPFGFADGVSSPMVDWERKRDPSGDKLSYENLVMLGEFVLGYPNEYGLYTNRPKIEDPKADLPDAEDSPGTKDLGRNGTFLVMRQIDQDVHGFWNFLSKQTGDNPTYTQELAEEFVGRRMSGASLIPQSDDRITGVGPDPDDIRLNQFTFDADPDGVSCPFGAHIRRANPRNADLPIGTPSSLWGRLSRILALDRVFGEGDNNIHRDRVASTRFHRLVRRGREYGPLLTQAQRIGPAQPDESPSGLHFICLNANIGRQFEFVQGAWIQSTSFDGLRDENDPIIGNRETISGCPAARFSLPVEGSIRQQIHDIPRFTTVRGGAYFFLPGIRALRYIARTSKVS